MTNKEVALFTLLRECDSDSETTINYIPGICCDLLRKSAKHGDTHIVKELLDSWSEYIDDSSAISSYTLAFRGCHMKMMDVLGPRIEALRPMIRLRFYELPTHDGLTISVDFARYCIENKYCKLDPAGDDNFAIQSAARCGNVELVKFLMTLPTVDPSADRSRALDSCLQGLMKIANHDKRARHIETIRALVSDFRVNSSKLGAHRNPDVKDKFIPEVADMVDSALRRRELCLHMKIKALPHIIPTFLRFLIVAQSILLNAVRNKKDHSFVLDVTILRKRLHVPREALMSYKTAIEKIFKCIESFLQ